MKRTTQTDLWTYPDASTLGTDVGRGVDLTGFSVEATDGGLGKIEEVTYDTSQSYIVVDTGPWIFSARRRPQRHSLERLRGRGRLRWCLGRSQQPTGRLAGRQLKNDAASKERIPPASMRVRGRMRQVVRPVCVVH